MSKTESAGPTPETITLTFDEGTLLLRSSRGRAVGGDSDAVATGLTWDSRVDAWRTHAYRYRDLLTTVARAARQSGAEIDDRCREYETLRLVHRAVREPFVHQREAIDAWTRAGQRGIVVLPTGSGKTYVAEMAIARVDRSTLVVVPTLDLVNQWHDDLAAAFDETIGVIGGGRRDVCRITVSTYDSAAIHMDRLGARFGLLVFDECHHLPSPSYLLAAEASIAPFRLGLTATLARGDSREALLAERVGAVVYERGIHELAGTHLAEYDTVRIAVPLEAEELQSYREHREAYRAFVSSHGIRMASPGGWQDFIMLSSRTQIGRSAFRSYREQRRIATASRHKLGVLEGLLRKHRAEPTLVFTNDNDSVYSIANTFLIPALTHQTPMSERKEILAKFRDRTYPAIVASRVLNEGVNLPDASVAIIVSGTSSVREHVQRLGRILRKRRDKRAVLYELVTQDTIEQRISERRREHDAYRRTQ